jgi:hypothetical protein
MVSYEFQKIKITPFIGLVYGKIHRNPPPYLMVKTMVSGKDIPLNQNEP